MKRRNWETESPDFYEKLKSEWSNQLNEKQIEDYSPGSTKKIWWECSLGHIWNASLNRRTSMYSGCPYCSNRRVLSGFNDLLTHYPELCKGWNCDKNKKGPECFAKNSRKKVWWICEFGHEWNSTIGSRAILNSGCPYCSGNKVLTGFNDLLTTHSKLCKEWNYKKNKKGPEHYSKGSHTKVWWECRLGHEWESVVKKRALNNNNCPYCSGYFIIKGETDLLTTHPELCKEWNFNKNKQGPEFHSKGSEKKVWWICKQGHEWKAILYNRANGAGCPKCPHKSQTITGEILKEYFTDIIFEPEFTIRKPIINESGEKIQNLTHVDYASVNLKIPIFIEYNGAQHYEEHDFFHNNESKGTFKKQQQRDRWLRNYCQNNNIFLIEIDGRKYKTREEIKNFLVSEFEIYIF